VPQESQFNLGDNARSQRSKQGESSRCGMLFNIHGTIKMLELQRLEIEKP